MGCARARRGVCVRWGSSCTRSEVAMGMRMSVFSFFLRSVSVFGLFVFGFILFLALDLEVAAGVLEVPRQFGNLPRSSLSPCLLGRLSQRISTFIL